MNINDIFERVQTMKSRFRLQTQGLGEANKSHSPETLTLAQAGELAKMISKSFSMSELDFLSMFLNKDPENLPHDTKDNMARELVLQANRENKIQKLLPKLQEERPHVDWFKILAS